MQEEGWSDERKEVYQNYLLLGKDLKDLSRSIHLWAASKGFRTEKDNMLAKLMLTVSELAEAGEEVRDGNWSNFQIEVIDCMIRCFDMLGAVESDVGKVLAWKMAVNYGRAHRHGRTNSEE